MTHGYVWLKGECWEVRDENGANIKCEECDNRANTELLAFFEDSIWWLCQECFEKVLEAEKTQVVQ